MILQRVNLVGIVGSTPREWAIPKNPAFCHLIVEPHGVKKSGLCWNNSTFVSVPFPLYLFCFNADSFSQNEFDESRRTVLQPQISVV